MKLKKLISALSAVSLFAGCLIAVPALSESTDPVFSVTFDDGSDAYVLKNGAALASGRSGNALLLDGTDDYAEINGASSALKSISGDFTISAWFNPSEIQWWQRVFDLGTGTSAYTFLSLGSPRFAIMNGSEQNFDSDTAISVGRWQNVTITRSGSTTEFWLDGYKTGSTTGISYKFSDLAKFTQCYLGKSQYPDPYYKGMIDDFAIYDRALVEDEIQTIAAEAYTAKKNEKVYANNCYVINTHFYSGDKEIFAYDSGSVKAVVNVENDTMNTGEISAALYAVSGTTETKLTEDVKASPASLEAAELILEASDIPAGAEKLIVKFNSGEEEYASAILYSGITAPVAAPADSNSTTNGAHDPSIVKFPNDDTYYVYSSHHLLFTSKDLINWKKYDFTNINAATMSPKSNSFINNNYKNTTMNGTYWAPDVIYVPDRDPEHPYWMYISLSCGLGGMNSVISLVKSDNPLFWADSNSDIVDMGVVFATKDGSGKTNSIDANIYIDTDGTYYFLWGSFWGGIQAAKLKTDGFVEGVNYTSDSTILSSCKNLGTSVFTQKRGVAGPEGGWMIDHGDYRYIFGSYAWLGSNYNTRVVRSPLATSFGTNTGTQMLDANGVVMGTEYSRSSGAVKAAEITGYKLIGSYRLGDGSNTLTEDNVNNWFYPRESGDAHVYYGPGHNSVINIGDETFYVSHTRKDAVEGAATLQVRKMLFTADGWPVVSPVTYAGEIEQKLPAGMIPGTYDLASVGVTKFAPGDTTINENWNNHSGNRNYDLPVISSKVTLEADGTMADGLGTWEFDGDHTVTLTFAKDGDTTKDEFYKSGDVMTLYALYGYDEDEAEPVLALTGTDQKHITQLAKKSMAAMFKTPTKTVTSEPVSIAKSAGGNPELGFDADGNILYAGDPAATVIGDTVYLICGHDTAENEAYKMPEWVLYTSKNMTDWEYKGVVMKATDISWRNTDTDAWASQMTEYGGKYYLYFCTWDKTSSGKQSIGVAVADKPEGPYKDALGKPLVAGTFTSPESSSWNDIDPTVLIDTVDGVEHRYLAWGNGKYYICELNEDMISVKDIDGDGQIVMHKDVKERTIKSMGGSVYTEAPWLYKRGGKYYLFYAMNWREEMAYAMADDPMGRYDFKQIIMPPTATSNTNHPSVIDFGGKTYFIYHNGALPHGSGFRRSVCIDELTFDENGYVYPVTETSIGLTGTASTLKSASGMYVGHSEFTNSLYDNAYPISAALTATTTENGYNTAWEIMPAKAAPSGEDADNYVSLQSVNKPGLYIASTGNGVTLTQDTYGTSGSIMTFKTVKGLDGKDNSVSFESVSDENKYLTVLGSGITLSYGTNPTDCSFTIADATEKDITTINVADVEPEPDPEPEITESFDSLSNGRLTYLNTSATPPYTGINGIALHISSRGNGADFSQNFSIQTGGRTGNALVLNAGDYQSSSRGPRMELKTPTIPNGYTAIAEVWVKQGKDGSVLRFNDSISTEAGTDIPGLSTDWQLLRISVKNDNYDYERTIEFNGNVISTDFFTTFPILWGTTENKTGQSIYFDDLTIKTTANEQTTEAPTSTPEASPVPAQPTSAPVDSITLSYKDNTAVITGLSDVPEDTKLIEAQYKDGKLTGVKLHTITDASAPVELSFTPEDGTLRLMLWSGIEPLTNAVTAK
ncbi:MAG: family 43 glycosylhydrolase [Clostridia bacterium]|nr:family 43 glycosylhydrolase [Clostridia bacterium]